jgi:hypothetical protein
MDQPFHGLTDPTPYVAACYAIATVLLVGFYAWTVWDRKRLKTLLVAVRKR